jgi:Flp pilus assembly protein TadD
LENEGGWGQLGFILYGQGRYYEAIAAFEKALTLNPKDGNIWMGLGDTWSALRKYESATEAFTSATKLRPNDNDLWIKLGSVYEKRGDKVNASEAYMKAEGDGTLMIHTEEKSGVIDENQRVDTALNSSMNESAPSLPSDNSTNTTES